MSYESIEGHITKNFPDGDYIFQAGPDNEDNRKIAIQKLKANGCRSIRFETHEMVMSETDSKLVTTNILYAHGYLANVHYANDAMQ